MRSLVCSLTLVLALMVAAAAPAAEGPGGRLFTLLGAPDAPCGPVGVFPDGSLLAAEQSSPRAWHVGVDGVRTSVTLPEPVVDVAADGPMSFVAIARSSRRILRVDLATNTTSVIVDLPTRFEDLFARVIALDDGSLVVDSSSALWRIANGEARVVVREPSDRALSADLAPLAGGAFAFVDFLLDRIVRLERDGRRTVLAQLASGSGPYTSLAAHGDELVAFTGADSDDVGPLTSMLRLRGSRVVESVGKVGAADVYGNGDGYSRLPPITPSRGWLGGDGELVFRDGCTVRALVPPANVRARIVLLPSTWRSFARGEIGYLASGAGTWRLTVRRAGGRIVQTTTGTTSGGVGAIRLPGAVPKGVFDVRLDLTTPPGGVVRAFGRFVTSDRLRMSTARRAIAGEVEGGDGDSGDGWGTELGRCEVRGPRQVACRVTYYWYNPDESHRGRCRGWAHAWLRADGVRVSDDDVHCPV